MYASFREMWSKFREDEITEVQYATFISWVKKLKIESPDENAEAVLSHYCSLDKDKKAKKSKTQTFYKAPSKVEVIKKLVPMAVEKDGVKYILGSDLIDTVMIAGAMSAATVYNRAKRLDIKFSAREYLPLDKCRSIITGA